MSSQRARIAARAHELWILRGKPQGSPEVDWHAAEKELEGAAADPAEPVSAPTPGRQAATDTQTAAAPGAPVATGTETASPDGPIPKRTRSKRNTRRTRDNGISGE